MDATPTPYALGPEEGEALWGIEGALTTIKASGEGTGGWLSVVEEVGRSGEVTPLHRHAEDDEAIYVLGGQVSFYLADDGPVSATPGLFIQVPRGTPHAFAVASETARYLIITTPRHGLFYRAISDPAGSRTLPPQAPFDMERAEAVCRDYGIEILGPRPARVPRRGRLRGAFGGARAR